MLPRETILNQSQHHPDACGSEAIVPIHFLSERAADQRTNGRAKMDSHVKDGEAGIAASAALRIEFPPHGADVRFQQTGPNDHQDQADEECFAAWNRKDEMTSGDNYATVANGALGTEDSISQPAAGQRSVICSGGIQSVDGSSDFVGKTEPALLDGVHHEQHEQGSHAVIAETFPHLGEEKGVEPTRVALGN